ncbi:putative Spy protein [Calothrix sp. NIES-2100]|uniref:Spy/CpxP family protein refolding chaperone n=1 Tax=Calothrix sp. NIES-2100 TaxID=1954172 RepID=UPI000B6001C8|nr:putative Spy protein [Calothrix sp. NIES-2100]
MHLRQISIVTAILITLSGASVIAQVSNSQKQLSAQTPTNPPTQPRKSGWLQDLNLTPQQLEQIKQIRRQSQDQIKPKQQALRQAQQELHNLLAGQASPAEVRTKYNQFKILKQQLADAQFENTLAIREILSLEQRQKFAEYMYKSQHNSPNRRPNIPIR